jgi:intraflagellar transport protein 80
VTDLHFCPTSADTFAVGGSDGTLRLYHRSGKEEKKVSATTVGGAVISVRWSHDGQAIVTGGEDGAVKVWSRAGMLRTTLVSGAKPVFAARWGADNNTILVASGRELSVATLQGDAGGSAGARTSSGKALAWKAHDGVVLCADWAPVSNRIVSGGEDCRYRVWDAYGRQLFVSAPFDTVVTAVAWAPSGAYFAVGAHGVLRLCDQLGWSHCRYVRH